jgi:uncharacterized membrane protein
MMRHICAALFSLAALGMSAPAHAALTVCNQTSYVIETVIGYQARTEATTQGWARIIPGKCANIYPFPLTSPAYYLYARSSQAHSGPARAWGGKIRLCAKNTNFVLHQPLIMDSCPPDSFIVPFSRIDAAAKRNWSTTLTESAALSTFDLARQAGIVRLLIDGGYKISDSRTAEAALKNFRARMKLGGNASNADLFDALETLALKAAAPAGYSICNDGRGEIYAAIGLREGKDWLSRGWWKVQPASCARVLTQPLSYDNVYLLAQSHNDQHLVAGAEKFCVADVEYESPLRNGCAAHGLSEEGFAATRTKGLTGYAAHVGDNGLVAPAHMPK